MGFEPVTLAPAMRWSSPSRLVGCLQAAAQNAARHVLSWLMVDRHDSTMGFIEGAGLVLTAIEFIEHHAAAGGEGGVNATSDKVTYPMGLDHSDAPHHMVPFLTVVLTPDGENNVAEAPLLAVANYGALGTYSPETVGVEPEQIRYEVANCQIAVSETKFYPMWGYAPVEALPLDIVASADPTPVDDSEGNPSIPTGNRI
jgi:hypothetical protein